METSLEIERKFLVGEADLSGAEDVRLVTIESVYLDIDKMAEFDPALLSSSSREIRVTKETDNEGYSTYRSTSKVGGYNLVREEAEIEISEEDFEKAVDKFGSKRLVKKRFRFFYNGNEFELDVFSNKKLLLMEIELGSERQLFEVPPFVHIIKDVTGDPDYYSFNIATEV